MFTRNRHHLVARQGLLGTRYELRPRRTRHHSRRIALIAAVAIVTLAIAQPRTDPTPTPTDPSGQDTTVTDTGHLPDTARTPATDERRP